MAVECPMCKKEVEKFKSGSHILPRFFLKPIRNEHGQIKTINVFKAIVDPKGQDLPKGDFICQTCENLTATLDGFGAKFLNRSPDLNLKIYTVKYGRIAYEHWMGISYLECRNFFLSIVIRDHCWRLQEKMPTLMSSAEFEKMRSLLMNTGAENSADELPIIVHSIEPTPIPNLHKITSPPTMSNLKDAVTFMGLGYGVMVYFKPPDDRNMQEYCKMFGLQRDGSIRMTFASLFNIGTWKSSEKAIAESYKKEEEKALRKELKNKKQS